MEAQGLEIWAEAPFSQDISVESHCVFVISPRENGSTSPVASTEAHRLMLMVVSPHGENSGVSFLQGFAKSKHLRFSQPILF